MCTLFKKWSVRCQFQSLHTLDFDGEEKKRKARPREGRRFRESNNGKGLKSFASESQIRQQDSRLQEQLDFLSQAVSVKLSL